MEGKEIYIKKADYITWRKNHVHDLIIPSFSKDLLKIIQSVKEPQKKEIPQIEVPAEEKIEEMDAPNLTLFFQKALYTKSDEEWKAVLSKVTRESFKEAILARQQNCLHYELRYLLEKLYPLIDDQQKEILLNVLVNLDALAGFFPEDQDLVQKVGERFLADIDKRKAFFQKIDKELTEDEIPFQKPVVKFLFEKLPKDPKELEALGKDNGFGFNLNTGPVIYEKQLGMIDMILENLPYEAACIVLKSTVHHPDFQAGFGLKLLNLVCKKLNQKGRLSDEAIRFSLNFLEELRKANKEEIFLDKIYDWRDGLNGPATTTAQTFLNCCIIGSLRYKPENSKKILDSLFRNMCLFVLIPQIENPNQVLEDHLSQEEKENFLEWAAIKLPGARFFNYQPKKPIPQPQPPNIQEVPNKEMDEVENLLKFEANVPQDAPKNDKLIAENPDIKVIPNQEVLPVDNLLNLFQGGNNNAF